MTPPPIEPDTADAVRRAACGCRMYEGARGEWVPMHEVGVCRGYRSERTQWVRMTHNDVAAICRTEMLKGKDRQIYDFAAGYNGERTYEAVAAAFAEYRRVYDV